MGVVIILGLINLASLLICHYVARARGANVTFWTVVGSVAGPLAVPLVFLARPQAH